MKVNLLAFRCPDATVKMNSVLNLFMQSEHSTLEVQTIEPSLERNIVERISHLELPLQLIDQNEAVITNNDIALWGDNFDEDDYGDVSVKKTYIITKQG